MTFLYSRSIIRGTTKDYHISLKLDPSLPKNKLNKFFFFFPLKPLIYFRISNVEMHINMSFFLTIAKWS